MPDRILALPPNQRAALTDLERFQSYTTESLRPHVVAMMILSIIGLGIFATVFPQPPAIDGMVPRMGILSTLSLIAWFCSRTPTYRGFVLWKVVYVTSYSLALRGYLSGELAHELWNLALCCTVMVVIAPLMQTRLECAFNMAAAWVILTPIDRVPESMTGNEAGILVISGSVMVCGILSFRASAAQRAQTFRRAEQLANFAYADPLTLLPNRRSFLTHAPEFLRGLPRPGLAAAVMMLDVDDFKRVNDTFGHDAGDQALCAIANVLADLGKDQLVARWGGEEFVVLARADSAAGLNWFAEQVRRSVNTLRLPHGALSVSIGMADVAPGESLSDLLIRADKALYAAKHQGKNRVARAA
ncbi:GGDEF domain-containing protein [Pigmentiphaga litoralis]|uniref:diguanylate cyclase n=1 Tax=Pigmentiphaga litoralis TaxID=516702 RepID=A0A7Y9LLJ2_9BURK|nr:GGDEF domain-containing protein [Pigmentiphaga litoralis]NYE22386.1 diguanylate cyclase (GGDEF)-like protein [Pigmentiphaga litoralis]NYE83999.1 diguanylate cyclase (GGDEF)-like protein [Pigmentiphaga litoralis]